MPASDFEIFQINGYVVATYAGGLKVVDLWVVHAKLFPDPDGSMRW